MHWWSSLLLSISILKQVTISEGFQQIQKPSPRIPLEIRATSIDLNDNPSTAASGDMGGKEDGRFPSRKLLIHWRGEKDAGYSKPFRKLEFASALLAEVEAPNGGESLLRFQNALHYTGQGQMADVNIEHFNEAMQFVSLNEEDCPENIPKIPRSAIISTVERSALVHACYEVIAESENLEELAELAIQDGGFEDMYKGGPNEAATWCFRARNYGDMPASTDNAVVGKEKRYSSSARSMKLEKEGLKALTELLLKFGGKVDLLHPDCKVYIFDGLVGGKKVLARRIAAGPRTSIIAPATRICITNTPLEPIAAFSLCNIARIRNHMAILDPYAGSGATLLASAMIAPLSKTVGIEIAHNGIVNREDIQKDFTSRNLTQPAALLQGDSTNTTIRDEARAAIQNRPFDAIIADPPYGIRESLSYNDKSPLEELFGSIAKDKQASERLLRIGGRLVAFVAVTDEETLDEMLPNEELTREAGLAFEVSREQPLNDKLSRWLVSYVCKE